MRALARLGWTQVTFAGYSGYDRRTVGDRLRPPLTAERLAQVWDQHPDPVVLELRCEIHRLRATIARADQVRKFMGPHRLHSVPGPLWECVNRELDCEPA